jgi:NADH dehydrogenase
MPDHSKRPHVVVLGGGFGGLTFCQKFSHETAQVTLIDRQNHHLFQPLLYQVATAGLSVPEIAQPIRSILKDRENITPLMGHVVDFDLAGKKVLLKDQTLAYDYLVIALGAVTGYFGHPEGERYAPGLKSLDDAVHIRRNVLLAFERAEKSEDKEEHDRLMTMVVVGGGPTGVEMAGALAELARHVLKSDFRRIDPAQARVVLIEASPRVLSHLPEDLSASALRHLQKIGVEVRMGIKVKDIRKGEVDLGDEIIRAENIVWAAGVAANPLTQKLGVELDRAGRIKVNPDCSLPGHPEVFGIGDIVSLTDSATGKLVPGVSPGAMQMAEHVAEIIRIELENGRFLSKRPEFHYWDKGTMATIGRSAAVAMVGNLKLTGFIAWLAWLFVHLLFLIGFQNKVTVVVQWVYSYFTYKRGARIITGLAKPPA